MIRPLSITWAQTYYFFALYSILVEIMPNSSLTSDQLPNRAILFCCCFFLDTYKMYIVASFTTLNVFEGLKDGWQDADSAERMH